MEPNGYELAMQKVGEQYLMEFEEYCRLKEWLFEDIKARRILAKLYRQYGSDGLVDVLEDLKQNNKLDVV